jgi:hypothetical protein
MWSGRHAGKPAEEDKTNKGKNNMMSKIIILRRDLCQE